MARAAKGCSVRPLRGGRFGLWQLDKKIGGQDDKTTCSGELIARLPSRCCSSASGLSSCSSEGSELRKHPPRHPPKRKNRGFVDQIDRPARFAQPRARAAGLGRALAGVVGRRRRNQSSRHTRCAVRRAATAHGVCLLRFLPSYGVGFTARPAIHAPHATVQTSPPAQIPMHTL
jgi:hypothetical protein